MNSMIQTVDLTKKFNDFVANDHINLDVKEQEIKCIVGENGAGKSTMMNMLYGLLQPTSGKILIRGKEVTLNSPVDAIANGIGMVHQHFKLVPSLTVYENILLGAEITQKKGGMKTPFIDQKEEIKRVEKLIQENHLELNATDKIEDISVGGRQRVGLDAAFNDCEADIAIAAMVGASFIRVPVFVDTVLFTDGIIQPCAKKCMEYRKMMGQENVKILADVQVKHAHMLREHITIEQSAKDAASNGADGIIVTGTQVGEETPLDLIKRVKNVVNLPVFAGSGVNAENIHDQLQTADGAIIGSSLKEGGILTNPISYELVKKVLDGLK